MSRPIVVITGASRGIGAAITAELEDTYRLILVGRDREALHTVSQRCSDAQVELCDLSNPLEIKELARRVGDVDVLINNAGMEAFGDLADLTWTEWQQAFALNVFAVAELTAQLLPGLRRQKGQVLMMNSGAGRFSGAGMGIYAGTKHALHALTVAVREEERGTVRVTAIHPGRVDTPMQRRMRTGSTYHPHEHVAPESIARAVRFAIEATDECTVEEISVRPVVKTASGAQ